MARFGSIHSIRTTLTAQLSHLASRPPSSDTPLPSSPSSSTLVAVRSTLSPALVWTASLLGKDFTEDRINQALFVRLKCSLFVQCRFAALHSTVASYKFLLSLRVDAPPSSLITRPPSRTWERFTKIYPVIVIVIVIVNARLSSPFSSHPCTLLARRILVYKSPWLAMTKARNHTPAFASSFLRPVTISFQIHKLVLSSNATISTPSTRLASPQSVRIPISPRPESSESSATL